MTTNFHLPGCTTRTSELDGSTIFWLCERDRGGDISLVISNADAARNAIAIGDAIRAAALKHLPAPEPVPMEV